MGERALTTEDYRSAPTGTGPLAPAWADKPHRLVYDLANAVDDLRAQLATVTAERDAARHRAAEAEADVERLRETVNEQAEEHRLGCERPKGAVNWHVPYSITIERLYAALDATTPRGAALRAAKAKSWDEGFRCRDDMAEDHTEWDPAEGTPNPYASDDGDGHG